MNFFKFIEFFCYYLKIKFFVKIKNVAVFSLQNDKMSL